MCCSLRNPYFDKMKKTIKFGVCMGSKLIFKLLPLIGFL